MTFDQAVKTASEKMSDKIVEAEPEKKHNKFVWEVEVVTAENKVMEGHIDADTGAVIDVEEDKAKLKKTRKQDRNPKHRPVKSLRE